MNIPGAELAARYKSQLAGITELAEPTIHILTRLFDYQKAHTIQGDMLEIGVFRAGTASLFAAGLEAKRRLFLIDPFQDEAVNRRTIEGFSQIKSDQLIFQSTDSRMVNKWRERMLTPHVPLLRLAHIDGEHSYDGVYSDIDLTFRYLAPGGLIILDDIFNMNSACCTHALFDYLHSQPLLHCVAMGYRKAYLCESRWVGLYREFFLKVPEMMAEAGLSVRLCFNSWGHERSYVTFDTCPEGEPRYQIIGRRFNTLQEALRGMIPG